MNSPMPGSIFKVECSVGQSVKAGDVLIVLEAMKMEIEVSAPVDGTVKSIAVAHRRHRQHRRSAWWFWAEHRPDTALR